MCVQNAASWGYFDCKRNKWNTEILEQAGFPVSILPEIKESSEIAGYLVDSWHGIPKGTPIGEFCNNKMVGIVNELVSCTINIFLN